MVVPIPKSLLRPENIRNMIKDYWYRLYSIWDECIYLLLKWCANDMGTGDCEMMTWVLVTRHEIESWVSHVTCDMCPVWAGDAGLNYPEAMSDWFPGQESCDQWILIKPSITRNKAPGIFWIISEYSRLEKSLGLRGWAGTLHTMWVSVTPGQCLLSPLSSRSRSQDWHGAPGPPGTVPMSAHRDFVWRSAFTAHKTFIFQAFYICGQYMRCINRKAWKWIIRIHFRNTGHFQEKKVESMRHESKFYGMKV